MYTKKDVSEVEKEWKSNKRWKGLVRPYSAEKVVQLRGSLHLQHTLAEQGAKKLWDYLEKEPFVKSHGCRDRKSSCSASAGRPQSCVRQRLASGR